MRTPLQIETAIAGVNKNIRLMRHYGDMQDPDQAGKLQSMLDSKAELEAELIAQQSALTQQGLPHTIDG